MKSAVALSEVCEITMGQAPRGESYNTNGEGLPLIAGAGDFGDLHPVSKKYTTEAGKVCERGDVILGIRATVGEKVVADGRYCLGRGVAGLRPRSGLDVRYLWHWLTHINPLLMSKARGATFLQVNRGDIGELPIVLPSQPEQRRIAAVLDKADALRTKRRKALAQLDRLAQSIFVEMFGDPAGANPSFSSVPLVELALGGFQNGAYFPKEAYSESGIEMVHMSDAFGGLVRRGQLRRVECDESDVAKYSLEKSDLLIARRSLTYEGAAKPCRVPDGSEPLLFESSFIRIRPDLSKVSTMFLFHYLNNERVREKFVRPFVTQSTISGINQSNLAKVPVLFPPSALQRKFELALASLEGLVLEHRRSAAELDQLFVCAQGRAFRGEL